MNKEKATFGAGCFWHIEEGFRKLKGVLSTSVGYMGGSLADPSYEDVCTGKTRHVEVCQVEFNPEIISYEELLNMFWEIHDPTQLNRQGPDIGREYRSIIFYHHENQKKLAFQSKEKQQKKLSKKIVTEIVKAGPFYKAEEYHQKYLMKRGLSVCSI